MNQAESQKDAQDRPEHQTRYHQVINAMDDGFCVCELLFDEQQQAYGYRFLEVNLTFEHHSGLKQAQGKTTMELVPNLEQKWFDAFAKVVLNGETSRFEQNSEVMGRWFEIYAFPFQLPNKQRTFAVQFKDISARKQAEKDLQEAKDELAASNEELRTANEELVETNDSLKRVNTDLDSFVYTASHDLKAPITNISSLLKMLVASLPPESQTAPRTQKVLGMMEKSVTRFMGTIADLSEITRLQKQADEPTELISLATVVDEVRMDIAFAIEEAQAQLNVDVRSCAPIQFAPRNLRSVVYNLLSNAVKYRDSQRPLIIRIACEEIDGFQVLTVADNGLGMSQSQGSKLFIMFKRFHDHVEGTGVGLYIVKKIVENSGGRIEVESQVGEGTTFRVYFKR